MVYPPPPYGLNIIAKDDLAGLPLGQEKLRKMTKVRKSQEKFLSLTCDNPGLVIR